MSSFQKRALFLLVVLVGAINVSFGQSETQGIYATKCQPCHGPTGTADTPMGKKFGAASFGSPEVAKTSDTELLAVLKNGKGKMPPFGNKFSEKQLEDLVVYVRNLRGK
jgi:mono/diheme cytochrome c family protein